MVKLLRCFGRWATVIVLGVTIRPKRDKISEVVGTTASENATVNILVAGGKSEIKWT